MTVDAVPKQLDALVEGRQERILLCGVSLQGWIYRKPQGDGVYRLIASKDAPLSRKRGVRQLLNENLGPGIAKITHEWSPSGRFYAVRYEASGTTRTLAEALDDPQVRTVERLDLLIAMFRQVTHWWERMGVPLLLTPADVLVNREHTAWLLPLPFWRLPDVNTVFQSPLRSLYLAPELICSRADLAWDTAAWVNVDRYAFGAFLWQCFHKLEAVADPGLALRLAANGAIADATVAGSRIELWLDQIDATEGALKVGRRLLDSEPSRRSNAAPESLAALLAEFCERMNPRAAVRETKRNNGAENAYSLVQSILVSGEDFNLLLEAAALAVELRRHLEAVEFFERAIALCPGEEDAYLKQFLLIDTARTHYGALDDLFTSNIRSAAQLCRKMIRDFEHFSLDMQEEQELRLARFLIWYGDQIPSAYSTALEFIFPRLSCPRIGFCWWKLGMNLAYAEALLKYARNAGNTAFPENYRVARKQLDAVRQSFQKARDAPQFSRGELHEHAYWLSWLEGEFLEASRQVKTAHEPFDNTRVDRQPGSSRPDQSR